MTLHTQARQILSHCWNRGIHNKWRIGTLFSTGDDNPCCSLIIFTRRFLVMSNADGTKFEQTDLSLCIRACMRILLLVCISVLYLTLAGYRTIDLSWGMLVWFLSYFLNSHNFSTISLSFSKSCSKYVEAINHYLLTINSSVFTWYGTMWLFPRLKVLLRGHRFELIDAIKEKLPEQKFVTYKTIVYL